MPLQNRAVETAHLFSGFIIGGFGGFILNKMRFQVKNSNVFLQLFRKGDKFRHTIPISTHGGDFERALVPCELNSIPGPIRWPVVGSLLEIMRKGGLQKQHTTLVNVAMQPISTRVISGVVVWMHHCHLQNVRRLMHRVNTNVFLKLKRTVEICE